MDRKKFIANAASSLALMPFLGTVRSFDFSAKYTKGLEKDALKICVTCGTQFPKKDTDAICKICSEERQYIPLDGQKWTTHAQIASTHKNKIIKLKEGLYELVMSPKFSIGQRAFLVVSKQGNVLWDCIPLLDEETIKFINELGGLKAIAISHPHYYSNMNTWAETFDCPIYIHENDKSHIHYKTDKVHLWKEGDKALWDSMKLVNIGGHFDGSSVMLIPNLSNNGVMLTGDTVYLSLSKKHYSVMYSYPNNIPLPIKRVKQIKDRFRNLAFDEIYGFYSYQNITKNARKLLFESLSRYK